MTCAATLVSRRRGACPLSQLALTSALKEPGPGRRAICLAPRAPGACAGDMI
ncbi:hypothetical protein BJX70DRAFT_367255 [Aspergillus crustosus]